MLTCKAGNDDFKDLERIDQEMEQLHLKTNHNNVDTREYVCMSI